MKRITMLLMAFMFWTFGHAQDALITGYVDSPCSGADGRTVEIYVNGTVDFTGWNLVRQSNGGGFTTNLDLSSLGSLTDEFAYITNDEATLDAEFSINSTNGNVIENGGISSNGDDAFQIVDASDVVIDRFGEDGVDGSSTDWEHTDTFYYRNDGATANAGVFDAINWTIGALDALDGQGTCNGEAALSTIVPFGSYTPNLSSPGETCANPIAITSLPYTTSDDTANYGDDYENSDNPCGNYLSGDDVVYAYTPAADMVVNITLSNVSDTWSGIHVLDACFDDNPNCVATEGNSGTSDRTIEALALTGGTTYYIVISTWAAPQSITYDLDIEELTCPPVTDILVDNIAENSADISWTENGSAIEWEILYGETGFDPATEGTSLADNDGTLGETLTGLNSGLNYDVYVRANCGSGDLSDWTGPVEFTTECAVYTPDYVENFENFLPNCWEEASSGLPIDGPSDLGFGSWTSDDFLNSGTNSARINLYSNSKEDWLISPSFDLSAADYELAFMTGVTAYSGSAASAMGSDDEVQLLISEDDGATWSNLLTYDASNTPTNTGQEEIIDLSAYSGTVKFAFWATEGTVDDSEDYNFYVDDFKVRIPPSCAAPAGIVIDNITANAADISWTENGSATEWEILYGETGFDPATEGTSVIDDDGTLGETLSGLTEVTEYDIYVRAVCAPGDESEWLGPVTFETECATFTAPFTEDFETSMDAMPDCWANTSSTSKIWEFDTEPSSGNNFSDHTSGGGYLVYVDASTSTTTPDATLATPFIDVSSLATPYLEFYVYHFANNDDSNKITVEVWDGTAWNEVYMDDNGDVDAWEKVGITLDSLTITGPIKVRFVVNTVIGDNYENDIAIDDVSVKDAPSCLSPSGLAASNITDTSADLMWTENGSATEWEILYGEVGFDPATEGTSVMDDDGTLGITLNGLSSATEYDVYVRAICAPGDESEWTGPITFETDCAVYVPDYLEDFTNFLPDCWEEAGSGLPADGPSDIGTGSWFSDEFLNTGSNNAATINLFTTGREEWLISPSFDLSGGTYELAYITAVTNYSSSAPSDMGSDDEVQLLISEDDGATWSNLLTYDASNTPSATGQQEIVDLSAYSGTVKFAFWATDGTVNDSEDYDFFVDDFEVRTPPACPTPADIVFDGITTTTVDISWTAGGTETEWEILYGEAGFDPATEGTSIIDNDNNLGETLTGLTASTGYDVYLRAICAPGDESEWIGPDSFTTQCEVINTAYSQDFEGVVGLPACWSIINLGDTNGWENSSDITGDAHSGTNAASISFGSIAHDDYLITPQIEIVAETNDLFSFWIKSRSSIFLESYEVLLSTTDTQAASFDVVLQAEEEAPNAWTQKEFDLSMYVGQTIYIAVRATGTDEFELYADDFVFEAFVEPCAAPTDIVVSTITDTSADISWTENGSATEWEILYGEAGFDPLTEGISISDTDALGESLTGLTPETDYDVYVRAICDVDDESDWTGPETFTTTAITCPAPTDIVVSTITDTSADISWTENGSATEWEILYGEAGFDPLTEGISISDTDALGESLTGLTPETDYDVYVRAICDINVESDWTGPETFTTTTSGGGGPIEDCGQTQVSNGFENGVFMEESGTQILANDFIVSTNTATFSADNITVNILSQGGINTMDVTFYEDNDGVPGTEIQTIQDLAPTSQAIIGTAFGYDVHEVVLDFTTPIDFAGDGNVNGTTYWVELSGVPTSAGTQLAWETTTVNPVGNNMVFDNENTTGWVESQEDDGVFSITGECTYNDLDCFTPENLMVTNLTASSADVEWTTVGDETQWTVEYGPAGFTLGSGTTEVVNGTPSTTISGLESMTEYDFYVIANCSDSDSAIAGPVSATTVDMYCPIDFSTVEPITFVELADVSNTSSEATDSPAHEYFLDIVGNVEQGETYTVTIEAYTGGDYVNTITLFADWNQNGSMDDDGERYDLGTIENSSGVDGVQLVADITVPAGATLGNTRMRVIKRYSFDGSFPNDSCDAGSTFGQAEDYTLNVLQSTVTCPAPTDVAISNIGDFTADITWTENGTAVEWEILYGEAGFDPLTEGTSVIDADGTPGYSLSGLTANTDYEVYVRAICDVDDESDWTGPEPFTTTNLSVDSVNFEGFSYYPNPVKNQLFIKATNSISQVEIYNLLGQVVMSKKVNQLDTQLDVANLASGTYLMQVTINNSVKTFKLIRE